MVGKEQKGQSFWKRFTAYVASSPQFDGLPKREHAQFKQRWEKINEIVNKFVGCYATATNQKAMKMAKQLYQYDKKKKFTMDHA